MGAKESEAFKFSEARDLQIRDSVNSYETYDLWSGSLGVLREDC